jgi:hypothetical protein
MPAISCPRCEGDGHLLCAECSGSGETPTQWAKVVCGSCYGGGHGVCSTCGGNGTVHITYSGARSSHALAAPGGTSFP